MDKVETQSISDMLDVYDSLMEEKKTIIYKIDKHDYDMRRVLMQADAIHLLNINWDLLRKVCSDR